MPVVDGVRISVSRHSDSKVQRTVKGAQEQWNACFKFQEEPKPQQHKKHHLRRRANAGELERSFEKLIQESP